MRKKKALWMYAALAIGGAMWFAGCEAVMEMLGFASVEEADVAGADAEKADVKGADAEEGNTISVEGGSENQNPTGGGGNPVDPEDGGNPVDPEDGDDPVDPEDGDDPVDPEDGDDPVDPEDGDDPVDPEDEDDPVDPVEYAQTPSIKAKFGVTETGTAGVKAAFQELSAFINNGGLAEDENKSEEDRVIRLGDWIDLEGGLTVKGYGAGGGAFSSDDEDMQWDANITMNGAPQGKMSRLIVVGINPFKNLNGNGATPHVVFQFQNIPVLRQMNPINDNAGGYPESEMRAYLTGKFLSGLKDAGVPEEVLWGPARVVSGRENGATTINDTLWLPTITEMLGGSHFIISGEGHETQENQAVLPYYADTSSRVKVYKTNTGYPVVPTYGGYRYWTGTAYNYTGSPLVNSPGFDVIGPSGHVHGNSGESSELGGCAPAFCVK